MSRYDNGNRIRSDIERRSVLAGYTMTAIFTPCFQQIVCMVLPDARNFIGSRTSFANGSPVTQDNIASVAATDIMHQMTIGIETGSKLSLSPTVHKASDFYRQTQTVLDNVGLSRNDEGLLFPTMIETVKALSGSSTTHDPRINVALAIWRQRGVAPIDVIEKEDLHPLINETTVPDAFVEDKGSQMELYQLPDEPIPVSQRLVPYYLQFTEIDHGQVWLGSLLKDLSGIHSGMISLN